MGDHSGLSGPLAAYAEYACISGLASRKPRAKPQWDDGHKDWAVSLPFPSLPALVVVGG